MKEPMDDLRYVSRVYPQIYSDMINFSNSNDMLEFWRVLYEYY